MKFRLLFIAAFSISNLAPLYANQAIIAIETPKLSKENIIGHAVGLRPYRKSGVRLEAVFNTNKLLIHNYGYGGFGLTLAFGGAQEVLDLISAQKKENMKQVAVLGAGVIGLATAYELMNNNYQVTIYADKFLPDTTSTVAAGIWSIPRIKPEWPEHYQEQIKRMIKNSTNRMMQSASASTPEFKGVRYITDFSLHANQKDNTLSRLFAPLETEDKKEVALQLAAGNLRKASQKTTLSIDNSIFLKDLYEKVLVQGATVIPKKFNSQEEIFNLSEPIIINCTSIGSHELFHDDEFTPVRGHVLYLKPQNNITYQLHAAVPGSSIFWVNIYPMKDKLLIGGVSEPNEWNDQAQENILDELLHNAQELFKTES